MNDLDKIIESVRQYKPEIEGQEEIKVKIINSINERRNILDYIFGWTEIVWLRRSLAFVSILIIMIFGLQQVFLVNRIDRIEKRMIGFNTESVLKYQRENVIANSVVLKQDEALPGRDSIKVASEDLLDLVRSYRELQDKYNMILENQDRIEKESDKQKL